MKILTSTNFDSAIQEAKTPVLVDFYADWCGPCKSVSPLLEELSLEYGDRFTIFKVNIEQEGNLAQKYNVMSIPNLVFFDKNKNPIKQLSGFQSKESLRGTIDEIIQS